MIVHGGGEVLVPTHLNFGKFMLDRLRKVKVDEPCLLNCTSGVKLTYGEFTQHAVNVSAALTELGVARGDTVAVAGEPCATFVPTTLAVMLTGAAYTPIELDCGRAVLVHKLNLSKPKYVIYSRLFWEAYSDVLRELDFIKTFICFDDIDDIKLSVATMASRHVDVTTFEPAVVRGETDVAMVAYSSGTTGMSKGVLLTHLNCIARTNLTWYHDAESMQTCFTLGKIFSTYVIFLMFYFISAGKRLIYTQNKSTELNIIQDYKVDTYPAVPMGIHEMVAAADEYDFGALKVVYCAGGHLSPALAKAFKLRYPHIKLLQLYGATEADVITVQRPSNTENSGVGITVPGMTIKVVDVQTRATLGPNQRGEICVRSPCLMKGYLGATSPYLDEQGFYLTGDLGYYDDRKQFYVVDRLKDIISFEGVKVCPADVEAVLLRHTAVREAVVVGKPVGTVKEMPVAFVVLRPGAQVTETELIDYVNKEVCPADVEAVLLRHTAVREAVVVGKPVGTVKEMPVAFVVLRPGAQVTETELIDYVNKEVSWYMQLRGGVRFVSELPRSSLQKIQRQRLREILELEESAHLINTQ